VLQFRLRCARATVKLAIEQDAADAGADGEIEEPIALACVAKAGFCEYGVVGIIIHGNGDAEFRAEEFQRLSPRQEPRVPTSSMMRVNGSSGPGQATPIPTKLALFLPAIFF
jgi:hypothetical protein